MADEEKKETKETKKCCKCTRMRKIIRRTLLGLAIFVGVILLIVSIVINQLDPIVKTAVETYGPKMLGVPVTLGKVDFSVLRMRFELCDLVVGNPEGYKTDNAISVGRIYVHVLPGTILFSDTIVVKQILVEDPAITYEVGLGNSNIGTILNNLNGDKSEKPEKEEKPEVAEKSEEGGQKVVIEEVCVSGGKIRLSAKILQGVAAPIPLPTVTLHDIGKEKEGGTSFLDANKQILTKTLTSVVDVSKEAFAKLTGLASDAAKAVGNGAKAAAGAVSDGVKSGFNAVKGLFGGKKEE